MNNAEKVLGDIAAMNTLVEHFPMGILDQWLTRRQFNSIFDFIVALLNECNMPTNEVMLDLMVKIYGFNLKQYGLNEGKYRASQLLSLVESKNYDSLEESKFLKTLEGGIKEILAALLASVYGCSSVPLIPDEVFDSDDLTGSTASLMPAELKNKIDNRYFDAQEDYPLHLPIGLIDMMGTLSINPLSDAGKMYYAVEGQDRYYKLNHEEREVVVPKISHKTSVEKVVETVNKYDNPIQLYFCNDGQDKWYFYTSALVGTPLQVTLVYELAETRETIRKTVTVNAGTGQSEDFILKVNEVGKIKNVIIENGSCFIEIGDGSTCVYFSEDSKPDSFTWDVQFADKNEITGTKEVVVEREVTINEHYNGFEKQVVYEYTEIEYNELGNNEPYRMSYLPTTDLDDSYPEYLVVFDGPSPSVLYRTKDMNAFIWYVINRGMKNSSTEYNHMMWDSRVSAEKEDVRRETDEEWNLWYNSKGKSSNSLRFPDMEFTPNAKLYPLLQMESSTKSNLTLHIPAQTYYKPKKRARLLKDRTVSNLTPYFNSTIYKFNSDYLANIQILHPKVLLYNMCNYLLGFSLDAAKNMNVNISVTKKIIQAKLSSAIKKIVEANDMEVEDCYMSFSNDEFNEMMEDMLRERYNASYYGGETSVVRTHDVKDYISAINEVSNAATPEGTVTAITKLVTEVTTNPGTEGSIDYGLSADIDGNILKKLLWAITNPIAEALFTPQVVLLLFINFSLTGMVKTDNIFGYDYSKVLNLVMNKLLGLLSSIIIYIKDKLVKELYELWKEKVKPLIEKWIAIEIKNRLEHWKVLLEESAEALRKCAEMGLLTADMIIKLKRRKKVYADIDDVDYADIITEKEQITPENSDSC